MSGGGGAKPPAALERLLARALGGETGLYVVGDLREEFGVRAAQVGRLRASLWYGLQVSRVIVRVWTSRGEGAMAGFLGSGGVGDRWQEWSRSVRSLARSPGFTAVAVLTVALGVGATTAVYSVVHGVLRDALPFGAPEELVSVQVNTGGTGWYGASVPEFMDFRDELTTITDLAGFTTGTTTVGDSLSPRRLPVAFVTQGFFPTMDVAPILGRHFTPEEDLPGASVSVVLSEGHWREAYGADPQILGQSLPTSTGSAVVVGVMPESFRFPTPSTAMWFPFRLDFANPAPRANHFVQMVGRLTPGMASDGASAEVRALAIRSTERYPENYSERGFRARAIPLQEAVVGTAARAIQVAFAGVLLVLLVACVNVANLLLSRGESRGRDLALQSALGAGRGRLTRELFRENLLLAVGGGVIGLAVGWIGTELIVVLAPEGTPRLENVGMRLPVLVFGALTVTACSLVVGLWPAIRFSRPDVGSVLSDGDRGGRGAASHRIRRTLVAGQIALAAALTLAAVVMVRSIGNLYDADRGFVEDNLVTARVDLPTSTYQDGASRVVFYRQVVEALAAQEAIRAAGAGSRLPLVNQYAQWSLALEGEPAQELGAAPDAYGTVTTPGYFGAMGIRPSAGRLFDETDGEESVLVAVVNETMARILWSGQEPLGRRFRMWVEGWPLVEVVGVIPDVAELRTGDVPQPRFYVPHAQAERSAYFTPAGMYLTVSAPLPASDLFGMMRAAVASLDPTVPVSEETTMRDVVDRSVAIERFASVMLQVFGLVAVLLAGVGVYGVMALSVGQRVWEIGLRKALGAQAGEVLGGVLKECGLLTVVGVAGGLIAGVWLTRWMEGLMYGVRGADPLSLGSVLLILVLAAMAAALVPALRASRVEPALALKG